MQVDAGNVGEDISVICTPSVSEAARRLGRKAVAQRWRIAGPRLTSERAVLARMGRKRERTSGRILSHHSTGTPQWGLNGVSPARFREHIGAALALGHAFVPASVIALGQGKPTRLAITFDDGLRSLLNVTPFLHQLAIPVSVFVVTGWLTGRGQALGCF